MKQKLGLIGAMALSLPVLLYAFWASPYTVQIVPKVAPEPIAAPKPKQAPRKRNRMAINYLPTSTVEYNSSVMYPENLTDENTGTSGVFSSAGSYIIFDLGAAYVIPYVAFDLAPFAGNLQFEGGNMADMSDAVDLGGAFGGSAGYGGQPTGEAGAYRYVKVTSDAGFQVNELYVYSADPFAPPSSTRTGAAGVIMRRRGK